MKKNKKNGFTLVELLSVIVIMGVITIMAIPGLTYLKSKNNNTKFLKYKEFIKEAAKLYTDSYAEDMFGFNGSGCYLLSYKDLIKKNYLKPFEDPNINCDNASTFVKVKKNGNKTTYIPSLKCVNKKGAAVYENITTKCETASSSIPTILIDVQSPDNINGWSDKKKFVISAHSDVGFIDNVSLSYGFNGDNVHVPTNMKSYNYKNSYGVKDISFEFTDDSSRDGKYYLYIDASNIISTKGFNADNLWSVELTFDSLPPTKPVVNNKFLNRWYNLSDVKREDYVVRLKSSDTGSGINYYRYRYPNSSSKWINYYNSGYNNFTTTPFTINRNEPVEFQACDRLGNCSESAFSHIMIDTVIPAITFDNKNANKWTNQTVKFTANGSDNLSGIKLFRYGYANNNIEQTNRLNVNGNSASISFGEEDTFKIYFKVIDNAGNVTTSYGGKAMIDKSGPVISGSNDCTSKCGECYSNINASENKSGIAKWQWKYNNGSWTDIHSSSKTYHDVWRSKDNIAYVQAIDKVGNVSNVYSFRVSFKSCVNCDGIGGTLEYNSSLGYICTKGASTQSYGCTYQTCGYGCAGCDGWNPPPPRGNGWCNSWYTKYCCWDVNDTCYRKVCPSGWHLNGDKCYRKANGA